MNAQATHAPNSKATTHLLPKQANWTTQTDGWCQTDGESRKMVSLKRLNFRKTPTNVREMQIFTRRHQYARKCWDLRKIFKKREKISSHPYGLGETFSPLVSVQTITNARQSRGSASSINSICAYMCIYVHICACMCIIII